MLFLLIVSPYCKVMELIVALEGPLVNRNVEDVAGGFAPSSKRNFEPSSLRSFERASPRGRCRPSGHRVPRSGRRRRTAAARRSYRAAALGTNEAPSSSNG